MSLRLKGRKVSFKKYSRYGGEPKVVEGKISQRPMWLEVILEDGRIVPVEEKNLYFIKRKK